jgi:hypothetical protein
MKLFIKKIKIIYNVKKKLKIENFQLYINAQDFFKFDIEKIEKLKEYSFSNKNKYNNHNLNYENNNNYNTHYFDLNFDSNIINENICKIDKEIFSCNFNLNFICKDRNNNQKNLKYLLYILRIQNWFRKILSKNKLKKLREEKYRIIKDREIISLINDSILKEENEENKNENDEEVYLDEINSSKYKIKNKRILKECREINPKENNKYFLHLNKDTYFNEISHKEKNYIIKLDLEEDPVLDAYIYTEEINISINDTYFKEEKSKENTTNNQVIFKPKKSNNEIKIEYLKDSENNNTINTLNNKIHNFNNNDIDINLNSTNKKCNKLLYNELNTEKENLNKNKEIDFINNNKQKEKSFITNKDGRIKEKEKEKKKEKENKKEIIHIKHKDSKIDIIKKKPKQKPKNHLNSNLSISPNLKMNNNVNNSKELIIKLNDSEVKKIIKIQRFIRRFIQNKKHNIERKNCCNCLLF